MSLSRRDLVGGTLALAALASPPLSSPAASQDEAVRAFRVEVPDSDLADLRQRLAATRWPDRETVGDESQGVRRAALGELIGEWRDRYDWRAFERRFNALPQFMTRIDGVDIQFTHVRSGHDGALPLILTHGWPGSVIEFMKVTGPLSNPTAHAGRAEDAFHLVIPSIPGHGFSGKPDSPGWGPDRVARAWAELMRRLGYGRYVSQGGDHGSVISDAMARLKLPGLLAIHVNMPATVPAEIAEVLKRGGSLPEGLQPNERAAFRQLDGFYRTGAAYGGMMSTRPQTLGYALADSPAGLAAFFYEKFAAWTYSGGVPERSLTRTEMLDDISLYWLTNTATSAARFYWENNANNFNAVDIDFPTAITVFPGEIYRAPRGWAERAYRKLIYWNEVDRGGHFAAWEEPDLFASEVRAAFSSLR